MTPFSHARQRVADAYLRSAVLPHGPRMSMREIDLWLDAQRASQFLAVRRVPLATMRDWALRGDPLVLGHRSGRFFTVEGVHVETDIGPVHAWDQPIIRQPEIGILGIITRVFDGLRHFLMQAKVEPGNVTGVQISPTVQATRSNYTRVHGGQTPLYLEYFLDRLRARVLVDQLQGEQGSRYLRKQNRNMIVEVDEEVPAEGRFCWMTLAQIKELLKRPNLVNMDTRTVLACLPLLGRGPLVPGEDPSDEPPLLIGDLPLGAFGQELLASVLEHARPVHATYELLHWLTNLRARHELTLTPRPLDGLADWELGEMALRRADGRYFSVIGVEVESGVREVTRWQQPLIAHDGHGLNGFVLQRKNGVLHFLVRACIYPGNFSLFELGSTVSRSNADEQFGQSTAPPYLDLFHQPPADWVRYDAVQSEEGGRFYQYQNRYMMIELPEDMPVDETPAHRWMTLGQIQDLLVHGYFNIEARNLLACLDLCHGART
ncbi:MAG: NDP-hexose 2,3-dehydratase family protein [Vicinamibacterales bacterium]